MLGWLKTILVSGFVIGLVVYSGVTMTQQNSNTRATMEVEGALMTALLGDSRGQGIDSGISRDEFITAVVGSIVETQKNHGKTVKVSYIFIDKNGNETSIEEDIRSIQFKTEIMDKKNPDETVSVSEKRVALDVIGNRDGNAGNGLQTKVIVFEPGIENRSKIEDIGNTATIESVTVNNGGVSHSVSGNKITVNVSGGKNNKTLVSGQITPAHTKYVQGETTKNYKKEGYEGELEEYVVGGDNAPETTKYVTNQLLPNYNREGYAGTLEKYLASGVYSSADTKYVTNQLGSTYTDIAGYKGTLSSYLFSGEVRPGLKKTVYNQPTPYYTDSEGYSGWLSGGGETNVHYYMTMAEWGAGVRFPDTLTLGDFQRHRDANENCIAYGEVRGSMYAIQAKKQSAYPASVYTPTYNWGNECGGVSYNYFYTNGGSFSVGATVMSQLYSFTTYAGEVQRPGVDTRVYRYQGNVTKPEVDTRKYAYQGVVTKEANDTLERKYRGYVVKPGVDTRVYSEGYAYVVTIKYRD